MKRRLTNALFSNHDQQQNEEPAAAESTKRPRRRQTTTRQPNYLLQSSLSVPAASPPPASTSTFVLTDEFKGDWWFWSTSDNVVTPCKPVLTNNDKNSAWYCERCSFVNWHWHLHCDMCGVKPKFYNPTTTATLTAFSSAVKGWHCTYCGADDNNPLRSTCRLCSLPYRPLPTNNPTTAPTTLLESVVPEPHPPSTIAVAAGASQNDHDVVDDNDWLMCDDDGISEPPLDSVIQMELPD